MSNVQIVACGATAFMRQMPDIVFDASGKS